MKRKQAAEALLLMADICERARINIEQFEVVGASKVGKREYGRIKDAMPTEREVDAMAQATEIAFLTAYYLLVAAEPDEDLNSVVGTAFQTTISELVKGRLGDYEVAMRRVREDG